MLLWQGLAYRALAFFSVLLLERGKQNKTTLLVCSSPSLRRGHPLSSVPPPVFVRVSLAARLGSRACRYILEGAALDDATKRALG